jgi:hypothetical protein
VVAPCVSFFFGGPKEKSFRFSPTKRVVCQKNDFDQCAGEEK